MDWTRIEMLMAADRRGSELRREERRELLTAWLHHPHEYTRRAVIVRRRTAKESRFKKPLTEVQKELAEMIAKPILEGFANFDDPSMS